MFDPTHEAPISSWRQKIHEIIFEAESSEGKLFDVSLLWMIVLSTAVVILESVASFREQYKPILLFLEWTFTIMFSIEFVLRLISVRHPLKYVFSFYGIVDILSILPAYLSFFVSGAQSLLVIRAIRLLRIFRLFKLGRHIGEASILIEALRASRAKITVFIGAVLTLALVMGSIMYLVEGEASGFTSIPRRVYWAIVTMTTVGYGDITPQTVFGQSLAALLMIMGYGIIAIPTGIVSAELVQASKSSNTIACINCSKEGHELDAKYCKYCSGKL